MVALSLTRHLVLATSSRSVNAKEANKALAASGQSIQFQEIELEGNLRSSWPIADMIKKFQQLHEDAFNIIVKPCLSFQSQRPEIVIVEKRDKFEDRVLAEVQKSLYDSSDGKICVMQFCHRSTFHTIFKKLTPEERKRVLFFTEHLVILGCQFPTMILVCDLIAINFHTKYITDMMTRATAQLKCIVHTSKQPLMIKGRPSFDTQYCSPSAIPLFFQRLCDRCEGPIFVKDIDDVISEDIKNQLDLKKVDLEWQYEHTMYEVQVQITSSPLHCPFLSRNSYGPVLLLRTDDEEEAQRHFKTMRNTVDRVNSFFIHQAKLLQKL